jgi:predicted RND superfamily exporter protein|tara:strand:- start:1424 stop:3724 length:2301 start_codon:yes stop_codon:yes gene_type:complete
MARLINFLLSQRYMLAVLAILLGGAISLGALKTTIDSSDDSILSEDDPYRLEVAQVNKDFPPSTSVLFAFMSPEGDVFNRDMLQAMQDLTDRYTDVESAVSVASLINHRLNAVDADIHRRDYLLPELDELTAQDLVKIREIALKDEDLTQSMLSPEGDMALAVIKFQATSEEQETQLQIAKTVVDLRDSLREQYPDQNIYVLGRILFEYDNYNAQVKDSKYLFPIVMLTVLGLMYFCLGSLSFALAIAAVSVMSVGLTVGAVGWAQVPFNQISNMGPLVVFMIAMADSIHLVSVYLQGLHKSLSKFEALRESLRVNIQPVTLATVTTAIGFLSLNYCASPGIYGFGNVVAIGVVWAFLVTFTLLPALILLLPVKKVPKPLGVKGFINFVANVVANHGTPLFWGSLTLIAVTFAMLPLNKVDFDRFSFIDKDSDFHTVISALAEKIGNDQSLVYSIDSGKYYGITEPEFLRKIEEFSLWLEEQPQTSFVTSYTGFLKNRNMAENDNDPAWEVLPEDNLQIIDYLVGYQLVQEIEPQLEPIFNADYSAIRLVVGTSNLSNVQLLDFSEQIEDWITLNMDPAYDVLHGDNSILYARLNKTISLQLMEGFTVSFLLITATLLVGLKSVRYGLLSIIPNLFPATIVFGIWGLLVGELSPYILMLFSISIGLVVDDSVHVLSKYIVARREGNSPEAAVQYSLDRAGSAITITTLSLAIGTFILVLSNTFYYQNVALLLTPIIITALLLDLLFLPPLLVRFDNWLERRKPSTV